MVKHKGSKSIPSSPCFSSPYSFSLALGTSHSHSHFASFIFRLERLDEHPTSSADTHTRCPTPTLQARFSPPAENTRLTRPTLSYTMRMPMSAIDPRRVRRPRTNLTTSVKTFRVRPTTKAKLPVVALGRGLLHSLCPSHFPRHMWAAGYPSPHLLSNRPLLLLQAAQVKVEETKACQPRRCGSMWPSLYISRWCIGTNHLSLMTHAHASRRAWKWTWSC
jgi:hypothetical protein